MIRTLCAVALSAFLVPSTSVGQTLPAPAPTSINPINGRGYAVFNAPVGISQTQAFVLAPQVGAQLAAPKAPHADAFIVGLLTSAHFLNDTIGPWLGGHQPSGSPEPQGGWQWPDGSPVAIPGQPYPGHWGNPALPLHFQSQPNEGCPVSTECAMHYLFFGAPAWNDLPNIGCVEGAPIAWVAEFPVPFTATTTGPGVGDLVLQLVPQAPGQASLPPNVVAVLILVSATLPRGAPGTAPLPWGIVANDSVFRASAGTPLMAGSPLHFPVSGNPYLAGPVSFAAGTLPGGLTLEFRAVAYASTGTFFLSGVSRVIT